MMANLSEMNFWTCNLMWVYFWKKKLFYFVIFGMLRYPINMNVDKFQALLKSNVRLIKLFISLQYITSEIWNKNKNKIGTGG
jgi:hypothetical protein